MAIYMDFMLREKQDMHELDKIKNSSLKTQYLIKRSYFYGLNYLKIKSFYEEKPLDS
jgi:hypothetical protein